LALETKDKISLGISVLAMGISILTFGIEEKGKLDQARAAEARMFESMYNLGLRIELCRNIANELERSASSATDYRSELSMERKIEMNELQMLLDQAELKTQISTLPSNLNSALDFVRSEIMGRYGARAAYAYNLGIQMQVLTEQEMLIMPDTVSLEKCENENTQILLSDDVRENHLGKEPPKPEECEWAFLSNFDSIVAPLNQEIEALGGPTRISGQPKTKEEANALIGAAIGKLERQWQENSM
jgi:hypothetical protein